MQMKGREEYLLSIPVLTTPPLSKLISHPKLFGNNVTLWKIYLNASNSFDTN